MTSDIQTIYKDAKQLNSFNDCAVSLLAEKNVLAMILSACVEEFRGKQIREILPYLDQPEIRIYDLVTDDCTGKEQQIRDYDILFTAEDPLDHQFRVFLVKLENPCTTTYRTLTNRTLAAVMEGNPFRRACKNRSLLSDEPFIAIGIRTCVEGEGADTLDEYDCRDVRHSTPECPSVLYTLKVLDVGSSQIEGCEPVFDMLRILSDPDLRADIRIRKLEEYGIELSRLGRLRTAEMEEIMRHSE